jgi:hypothetical protein
MDLIKTKDGKPFESEQAANLRMGVLRKDGVETQVVEIEGGYALKPIESQKRKKRVPLGTRDRLKYPTRKGYVRRVFNDKDDRIQRALDAGYEFVTDNLPGGDPRAGAPTQVGAKVMKEVGGGTKGYLMEIPEEYYKEDQKAKQDRIAANEAQMKQEKTDGVSGLYGKVTLGR